jgi:tRNA A-37 threonylcarbamoyl transferase component Bud32
MNDFIAPGWKAILGHNDLNKFEVLWELQADWFEPPNHRRGGWSGVSRITLAAPQGGEETIFLKRQENHTRKTWRHPVSREPTFRGEARNLRLLNRHGIGAPELVYYAERHTPKGWQVILATRELKGYAPLDVLIEEWQQQGWKKSHDLRQRIIPKAATVIRRLHALNLVHNALHAKHLFVQRDSGAVCLIDLEKMRRRLFRRQAMLRDLDSCNRRTSGISRTDRLRFLLSYLQLESMTPQAKKIWLELAELEQRKRADLRE